MGIKGRKGQGENTIWPNQMISDNSAAGYANQPHIMSLSTCII